MLSTLKYNPDNRNMLCFHTGGEYKHCIEFLSIKRITDV